MSSAPAENPVPQKPLAEVALRLIAENPGYVVQTREVFAGGHQALYAQLVMQTADNHRVIIKTEDGPPQPTIDIRLYPGASGQGPRERRIAFSAGRAYESVEAFSFGGFGSTSPEPAPTSLFGSGRSRLANRSMQALARAMTTAEIDNISHLIYNSHVLNPHHGYTRVDEQAADFEHGSFLPDYLRNYLAGWPWNSRAERALRADLKHRGLRFIYGVDLAAEQGENPVINVLTLSVRRLIEREQHLSHDVAGPDIPVYLGPTDTRGEYQIGIWSTNTGTELAMTDGLYAPLPTHLSQLVLGKTIRPERLSDHAALPIDSYTGLSIAD